jgi:hypothetical protein
VESLLDGDMRDVSVEAKFGYFWRHLGRLQSPESTNLGALESPQAAIFYLWSVTS